MYVTTHRSPIGLGAWLGEQPAPQINWCQMRQTIATTVRGEFARWTAPNGQQFLENHPSRLPVLREYWAAVPVGNPAAASGGNEGDSVRITRFPLDQNGHIANPQDNHIFGMIKIVGCR